jgi:hypothetical protein
LLGVIGGDFEVIDFIGVQFPKAAILYAVFFYGKPTPRTVWRHAVLTTY